MSCSQQKKQNHHNFFLDQEFQMNLTDIDHLLSNIYQNLNKQLYMFPKQSQYFVQSKKTLEVFLPLQINTLNFLEIEEYENSNHVILSNHRKYICLIKYSFFQIFTIQKATIKLYNIETQQLLKTFEESKQYEGCEFSEDSQVLLIKNTEYFILYYIQSEQEIKINKKETIVRLSSDSLKYMWTTQDLIQINDNISIIEYKNTITNSKWDFSKYKNYLLCFSKNQHLFQFKYFRIENKKLKLVQNKINFQMICLGNQFNYLELCVSLMIVIFQPSIIKIYSLGGKLIRNMASNTQTYLPMKMRKDINNKWTLVTIVKSRGIFSGPTKQIEYMSLLPEVKTQIFELMGKQLKLYESSLVFLEVDEQKTLDVHYLD